MILVVGATGTIGRASIAALRSRGVPLWALTRRPDAAGLPAAVEVHAGDLADPESLSAAMDGVTAVVAVTVGSQKARFDASIAEAAAAAGVQRVVAVSSLAVDEDPDATLGRWHAEGERVLFDSRVAVSVLRPNGFFTNTLAWTAQLSHGSVIELALPDLRAAHVDPVDVAEVAAAVALDHAHRPEREVLRLTGPRAISAREQVGMLAEVIGRPLGVQEIDLAEEHDRLSARVPADIAAAVLEARSHAGPVRAQVFPDVPLVTGRPATAFENFLERHRDVFADPAAHLSTTGHGRAGFGRP